MQADREEKGTGQIPNAAPTTQAKDADVVGDGAEQIHHRPAAPHGDSFQTRRSRQLEDREEKQPERFAVPFIANEPRLPLIGDIRIKFVISLVSMMLEMVDAKTDRTGDEIRQVRQDGGDFVQELVLKNKIMGRIVDDHIRAVVRERTEAVGHNQTQPPSLGTQCSHRAGDRGLRAQDEDRNESGVSISAHQSSNFGMRLEDGARPLRMRLVKFGLMEGRLHRELQD